VSDQTFSLNNPQDQAALDELAQLIVDDGVSNHEMMARAMVGIKGAITKASTYDEVLAIIDLEYAELKTKALQDKLQHAIFIAATWGRLHPNR
jgi:phage gp29-like protein